MLDYVGENFNINRAIIDFFGRYLTANVVIIDRLRGLEKGQAQ
jgi:hypothetical protein